ncbi:hypothetical protein WDU94_005472 [Cyamophila willieti]
MESQDPEELQDNCLTTMGRNVKIIRVEWAHQGLWPSTSSEVPTCISHLANSLREKMDEAHGHGFLFTGLNNTVSFWQRDNQFFLFDPHAVSSRRQHDLLFENNSARLFSCNSFEGLASLLLKNAPLKSCSDEYSIHRVYFSVATSHLEVETQERVCLPRTPELVRKPHILHPEAMSVSPLLQEDVVHPEAMSVSPFLQEDVVLNVENSTISNVGGRPKKKRRRTLIEKKQPTSIGKAEQSKLGQLEKEMSNVTIGSIVHGSPRQAQLEVCKKRILPSSPRQDPKLRTACVVISPLNMDLGSPGESITSRKKAGRPKKSKRGRPKFQKSTQEEQLSTC